MTALPKFYFLAASKEVLLSLSTQHSSTGRLAGWLKMLKKFVPDGRNRHMYHTHPGTIFLLIRYRKRRSLHVSFQHRGLESMPLLQFMEGMMMITHSHGDQMLDRVMINIIGYCRYFQRRLFLQLSAISQLVSL